MRKVSTVLATGPRRLRSRLLGAAMDTLPVWVFRRMMEYRFINFGVETTNICNANCSFCGYRYMQRPKKEQFASQGSSTQGRPVAAIL